MRLSGPRKKELGLFGGFPEYPLFISDPSPGAGRTCAADIPLRLSDCSGSGRSGGWSLGDTSFRKTGRIFNKSSSKIQRIFTAQLKAVL